LRVWARSPGARPGVAGLLGIGLHGSARRSIGPPEVTPGAVGVSCFTSRQAWFRRVRAHGFIWVVWVRWLGHARSRRNWVSSLFSLPDSFSHSDSTITSSLSPHLSLSLISLCSVRKAGSKE
jgi:hypothetical protein